MSNNWNQLDDRSGTPRDHGPIKKTGGLLSHYRQQSSASPSTTQQFANPSAPSQFSSTAGSQYNLASQFLPSRLPTKAQQNIPHQTSQPSQRLIPASQQQQAGWVSNTVQFMRQVSGKMLALGHHYYSPPEPPLERYHSARSQRVHPTPNKLSLVEVRPWKRSLSIRVAYKMRRRRDRWQRSQFGLGKIAGVVVLILATVAILSSSIGGAYAYNYYQQESTQVSSIANKSNPQTTRIYDRNNTLIAERYDQGEGSSGRLTPISYQDIPQIMQEAQIAAEDRSFWTNAGIDPQGILRAATSGNGGGSTITQQVIKNQTGNDAPSYARKLVEATLALGMTQQYPKWKILEMYFNSVPYGTQDLGLESAARDYFGLQPTCDKNFTCTPAIAKLNLDPKTGKENPIVGLARASLLAAIPNNPTIYDPTVSETTLANALERQKYVLEQMKTLGTVKIGGKLLDDAMIQQAEKLTSSWKFRPYSAIKNAPHFVDWVTIQVEQMLGQGNTQAGVRAFLTGGFNIRTTIDMTLQKYVEAASRYFLTKPTPQKFLPVAWATLNTPQYNVNDAAVVVINSKTGEVLAMSGSIDYFKSNNDKRVGGNVNVATSVRGPGSTFKPLVYATAFQMGWNPGLVLPDIRTYFPNGNEAGLPDTDERIYSPTDYGGKPNELSGPQSTIREAIANSYNIPAVKAMTYAGLSNVFTNARLMGITSIDKDMKTRGCNPSNPLVCYGVTPVLGTVDITPLEMTSAYQTFANDGVHLPYQNILDIWDNYGHHLYHNDIAKAKSTRVFSSQVNYLLTSVLADEPSRAREFPGDHDLSFYDWDLSCASAIKTYISCETYQVAAKTGTTDSFKDNWTIGYTPRATVGVWAGNANGEDMARGVVGITGAAPIWHAVMEFVSGRPCADINTSMQVQISCPASQYNPAKVGMTGATTFSQPDGVSHVCNLSSQDGLAGVGICDWVIDGQVPTSSGVRDH